MLALALMWYAVLVAALAAPPSACGSLPSTKQPDRAWVDASRKTYDVVAPRFQTYVISDDTLDQATKDSLLRVVDDWDFMIRAGEKHVAPTGTAITFTPAPEPKGGGN